MDGNILGEFLRARRELVAPEDVGLPAGGTRRVAGLRREEVALLAGISADYYLRLEQGRDRHPSVQVLESIARVLGLEPAATQYLVSLAAPRPRTARRARREKPATGVGLLLGQLGLPAFVEGRYFDILAANPLAAAVSRNLVVGRNRVRDMFLDPYERSLYPDWERLLTTMVGGIRDRIGTDHDDPRFVELVGELSLGSEIFRQAWARHDVRAVHGKPVRMVHPQVGELTLRMEKLAVAGAEGQLLAVYHAEPGTADAEKLALLSAMAVPQASPTDSLTSN
ncbi:helix-turn-helix transcriptional regulator [Spongisporangium articulatum]|uniref:Helix-turn-helix transcriptional regulator n=1 Tax=Spongisporangium articulatum TaxID=3362603 RepID=A0ABW8AKM8_9ACTN